MVLELNKEDKKEDKLGPAPDTEVKVWGLGLTNNKLDQIIDLLDRNNYLMANILKALNSQIA